MIYMVFVSTQPVYFFLTGAFIYLHLKVIINMHDAIAIFLIVLAFCRSFPSLVFSVYSSSFSVCCKTGLVVLNSPNSCLSVRLLISALNLIESFAGWSVLPRRCTCFSL